MFAPRASDSNRGALLATLARACCPYGSVRRVMRGPARGMLFKVEPGIGMSYMLGRREAAPRFFDRGIKSGMTVVDVGANKGQMALIFAALVGPTGRVIALEPAPRECDSLEENIRRNRLGCVTVIRAAAADRQGSLRFDYAADSPTQGKLAEFEPTYEQSNASSLTVEARTLDSLLETGIRPDFIKIDAEGSASAVLKGATELIGATHPTFYIELHGPEEQAGVRDYLTSQGYSAFLLDGTRVDDPTSGWFSPLWCTPPEAHLRHDVGLSHQGGRGI